MNLVIDVGNSFTKVGVFNSDTVVLTTSYATDELLLQLEKLQSEHAITRAIIAFVGYLTDEQLTQIAALFPLHVLTQHSRIPFTNDYATPHSLGVDRMALTAAAAVNYPSQDVLIIDMGTCITYDFITRDNRYLGGGISPGITMRYKALHTYTSNLPLLTPKVPIEMIGDNTENSIHSGIMEGARNEIDGFIASYKNKYPNLTVILTGGDAHFLRDHIKNHIFANPIFLLEGLNHILNHNPS